MMKIYVVLTSSLIMMGLTPINLGWINMLLILFILTMLLMFSNGMVESDMMLMGYNMEMSIVSFSLVFLSFWISILMLLSSFKLAMKSEFYVYFNFCVVGLTLILALTFFCDSSIMFYFFFEASIIPTLIIILGWGYQPERLQAGLYFLFYTLTASLPLLLSIMYVYTNMGSFMFYFNGEFVNGLLSNFMMIILGLGLMMAFLAKLPMFMLHLWLPKAHVEAPVAGSMILAGVLLKLGGYGLMVFSPVVMIMLWYMGGYLVGLSLAGMMFVGFICLRLNDFKALVAYSSVAHMAMVICGVVSFYNWGYSGALIMMIGHGLSSSGLFSIVNMYYERLGSRSFYINRGLLLIAPIFTLFMFLLISANIAAPPTINLLSEIFLMGGIIGYDKFMLLLFPLGSFLGAVFSLFMYSYSQHGKIYNFMYSLMFSSHREFHILFLHVLPVNFLILSVPNFMSYL